jgi:hypothetical protein
MDHLDVYALRRQNALLARRLELIESILDATGILETALAGRMYGDAISASAAGRLEDLSGLSKAELEATLHNITAERTRLDAFESMIQEEIRACAPVS